MSLNYKDRDEYTYQIFFYSEPYFVLLENDGVIDIATKIEEPQYKKSLRRYGPIKSKQFIEIIYDDKFFDYNIKESKRKTFSITLQIYNRVGQFLQQIDFLGEDMQMLDKPQGKCLILTYDQVTNNNAWGSLPNSFHEAADVYKREKVSWLRDLQINKILS